MWSTEDVQGRETTPTAWLPEGWVHASHVSQGPRGGGQQATPRVDGGRRVTMTCWCGFADAKACSTGVRNDEVGRSPASGAEDTWELSVLSVQFG